MLLYKKDWEFQVMRDCMKRWVITGSILIMLLAGIAQAAWAQQTTPIQDTVEFTHTVDPAGLNPGAKTSGNVRLVGKSNTACEGIPKRPVDTMLVFDISTSAGMGPGSNWDRTVSLTLQLLNSLGKPIYSTPTTPPDLSRTALIVSQTGSLGPEPLLLQDLTHDHNLLHNTVSQLTPTGDTDIAAGVMLALEKLKAAKDPLREQAIILMMHDNVPLNPATEAAIKEADSQKIPVYMIVNDLNLKPEQSITREQAAKMIPPERLVLKPDTASLRTLFLDMTDGSADLAARSLSLRLNILPAGQVDLLSADGPNGQIHGDQVEWLIDDLRVGETVNLNYDMRVRPTAGNSLNFQAEMNWIDCSGVPVLGVMPLGVPINVQPITTLAPAVGVTPASSEVTPTPATAVGSISTPTAGYPAPSGLIPICSFPFGNCNDWYCYLLFLLPLLLLLFLFIMWRRRRRPEKIGGVPLRPLSQPALTPPPSTAPVRRVPEGGPMYEKWDTQERTGPGGQTIFLRTRSNPPTHTELVAALRKGEPARLVARVDPRVLNTSNREIGSAALELHSTKTLDPITGMSRSATYAELQSLEVDNAWRRKKIGQLLLSTLEQNAALYQATYIEGVVQDQDDFRPLLLFFEKMGYRCEKTPQGYLLHKDLKSS